MNTHHKKSNRFLLLDFLRTISFFPIVIFHAQLVKWYDPGVDLSAEVPAIAVLEAVVRSLSFSGFSIVFLTSFLMGLRPRKIKKRTSLLTFLLIGWVLLSLLSLYFGGDFSLTWDVYPLIALGIITSTLFHSAFSNRFGVVLPSIGFILLWIKPWDWIELNGYLGNALGFASCQTEVAEWPIFPWIGLVWLGYGLGHYVKENLKDGGISLTKREGVMWLLFIAASLPHFGPFYNIRLGVYFSCDVYRMPPEIFWAHLSLPLAITRVALIPRVNKAVHEMKFFTWLSTLAINRVFWLAYIVAYFQNFIVCYLIEVFIEGSPNYGTWITLIAYTWFPLTEVLTRFVEKSFLHIKNWAKGPNS